MRTITEVAEEPVGDLTKGEIRLRISSAIPLNGAYTCFGKADLNAIYRHLTGDYIFPKKHWGTPDSPSMLYIRATVADEVGFDYEADRPRQYRHEELVAVCEAVEEAGVEQQRMEVTA